MGRDNGEDAQRNDKGAGLLNPEVREISGWKTYRDAFRVRLNYLEIASQVFSMKAKPA